MEILKSDPAMSYCGESNRNVIIDVETGENSKSLQSLSSVVCETLPHNKRSGGKTTNKLFTSAFKSIKLKTIKRFKSENNLTKSNSSIMNEGEQISLSKTLNPKQSKKSKASNLVKKFTSLKKYKNVSKKEENILSSSSSLKRRTPEGGNLNQSSSSLLIIGDDENKKNEVKKKISKVSSLNIELPVEPISIDFNVNAVVKGNKEISPDKPPLIKAPTVPYHITEEEVSSLVYSKTNITEQSKGAIKKDLDNIKIKKQKSRDEFFESLGSMKPSEIPKPIRRSSKEIKSNENLGNNLDNPNLANFKLKNCTEDSFDSISQPEIVFDIGTTVRPPKVIEFLSSSPRESLLKEDSIDAKSDTSIDLENSRRRIAFVTQTTVQTEEEQKILDENCEIPSYLSILSDISLDSNFSIDQEQQTNMSPHGDLITSERQVVTY